MTYTTTAPTKRRQPRPLTTEDRLRQEIAALWAELDRQKAGFDVIVADLQRQHREKVQAVADEANAFIAAIEEKANADIAASQQAQVEADEKILAVWQENCRILADENEMLSAKVAELEAKLALLETEKSARVKRKERRWRERTIGSEL